MQQEQFCTSSQGWWTVGTGTSIALALFFIIVLMWHGWPNVVDQLAWWQHKFLQALRRHAAAIRVAHQNRADFIRERWQKENT